MRILHPHIPNPPHRLVPFILLSLLLHVALLYVIRPATKSHLPHPRPIEVYFSAPTTPEPARIPDIAPAEVHDNPPIPSASTMEHAERIAQPDTPAPPVFNSQQLMESAKSMARIEARKAEQLFAAEEKKKTNTPIGSLDQYLRQPHDEIRLANGMLKIVTDAGEICFQPPPAFARDMPNLYGIPMTCP
ncbi:MAG: hypothetical protein A2063_02875 [Gallionellales bacterium GWA2_60_142]|nr:MAG: hypothetical protein A2063_02875 [Gallionellales bacterium GWA2_60_142]HCI13135.1 hypothetical protein [Gallionellaceae bacterium]